MRLVSLALLIIMAASVVAGYVIEYCLGYCEDTWAPLGYGFLMVVIFCVTPVLIIFCAVISTLRRKHREWMTGIIAGVLILVGIDYFVAPFPGQMVVYGLRDRLRHDFTPDTLRQFAREIDRMPRSAGDKDPAVKKISRADLEKAGMRPKYSFLGWMRGEGPSSVYEQDGIVHVNWDGGGLAGYWGFLIKVNGDKLDKPLEQSDKYLHVSDDILVTKGTQEGEFPPI